MKATKARARNSPRRYQYTAVFEPAEEGGVVVQVPALPGLWTQGETLAEARAMARDAIAGYSDDARITSQIWGEGVVQDW